MARRFGLAVVLTIDDPDHSPVNRSAFDRLVRRLKEEMARGRDSGAFLLPGVTLEMLTYYRECLERN